MNKKIHGRVNKRDLGLVAEALRPIRSCAEVGRILGLSSTAVCAIENSALRKIIHAMRETEKNYQPKKQYE